MNLDKGMIVRVVLFVLAWVNSFLASKGFKTIPVLDDSQVAEIITFAITAYGVIKHEFFGKKKDKVEAPVVPIVEPVKVEQPDPAPVVPVQPVTQPTEAPVAPVQQDNQTK